MNKIILVKTNNEEVVIDRYEGVKIDFRGDNCVVKFYEGTLFNNCIFICGKGTKISIKHSKFPICGLHIFSDEAVNNIVDIGDDLSCWSCDLKCLSSNKILIGRDCQFSYDITIWNTDGHAIFNKDGICINPVQDVIIGNHVWIGHRVEILKGSVVPDNSVIGACSLINKVFTKSNVILAGIPAKIIKEDIRWDRLNPTYFS